MLRCIWAKKVNGTSANSPRTQSWVASSRFACDHSAGQPVP